MKRPSVFLQRRGDMDSTMTPMIDVVFLLLVFFVWTASFSIVEQVLPSQLSTAAGTQPGSDQPPPPEADFDNVVIRIFWTGAEAAWEINETPVSTLEQVRERLRLIAAVKRDAPVILFPDPEVPLGDVIDVYDLSKLENFEEVSFAVREQGS